MNDLNLSCFKLNLVAFAFMVLCGCAKHEESNCFILNNPINCSTIQLKLSDICSDIQYVTLDSQITFDIILKIQFSDTNIVLKTKSDGMLLYNKDGSFISRIGKYGKGPGEYSRIFSQLTINNNGDRIYILDYWRKVMVYNKNGRYLNKFEFSDSIRMEDISCLSNNRLLLTAGNPDGKSNFNWIVADSIGNVIYFKKNNVKFKMAKGAGPSPSHILFGDNCDFNYFEQYNDTIFKICEDSFEIYALFNLNPIRLTPELAAIEGPINMGKKYIWPINIFETKKYLFMEYIFKEKGLARFNKETKMWHNVFTHSGKNGIVNDIDGGLPFNPKARYEDLLIGYIYPYELIQHVASVAFKDSTPKYPEKKRELEKLANSLDENDNPVLMLVKLKE